MVDGLAVFEIEEFVGSESGGANESAQSAFGDLFVIGYGKGCDMAVFNQNDVTAALPDNFPSVTFVENTEPLCDR